MSRRNPQPGPSEKEAQLRAILPRGIPRIFTTREEWLESRRHGIGGSEAAMAVGASRFKAPFTLWAEKRGLVPPEDLDGIEDIEWGLLHEPTIAAKFCKVTGARLFDLEEGEILKVDSSEEAHRFTSPDRIILEPTETLFEFGMARATGPGSVNLLPFDLAALRGPGYLEIKHSRMGMQSRWEEEPPLDPMIQLQNGLAITGLSWGVFAVLFGGVHFQIFGPFNLDPAFDQWLREKLEAFWRMVEKGEAPEIEAEDSRALAVLYPQEVEGQVVRMPEAYELHARLEDIQRRLDDTVAERDALRNRLKAKIGKAEKGVISPDLCYTLRTVRRAGYWTEPTEYRSLRVSKGEAG